MKDPFIDVMSQSFSGQKTDRFEHDLILVEDPYYKEGYDFPFSLNSTSCIIIREGSMRCSVDMKIHDITSTGMLILLSGQIVEWIAFSPDFKGYFILMSENFGKKLSIDSSYYLYRNVQDNGFFPLNMEGIEALTAYFKMLQGVLRVDNPYKQEIIKHLTLAYFYGLSPYIHTNVGQNSMSRFEELTNEYITLVRTHCREHRDIVFYADRLSITPKHLSRVVSTTTGETAMKWVEKYTILNAKNLLKTTTYTIGQISDMLTFGSQSDFGKYFKKATGLSPAAFRKG